MSIDWSKPVRRIGRSSTANSYRVMIPVNGYFVEE